MTRGTKSLLWGVHSFLWHPFIVAFCYWKLYGFPWSYKLWLCFFLHDIGYFGCPNMDGKELGGGKWHPLRGAILIGDILGGQWMSFCLFHSRSITEYFLNIVKHDDSFDDSKLNISRLCVADKLAVKYTPLIFFNKDELEEYMNENNMTDPKEWKRHINMWSEEFVKNNKDIALDVTNYPNNKLQ